MTMINELRELLAKANADGPLEYYEDMGEEMGRTTHMTERGRAVYRLPQEALRALPGLLAVADAAERLAKDICDDSGATQNQHCVAIEILDELTKVSAR